MMQVTHILKKFSFKEDKPPILYRPGTSDESIIQTVLVEGKEYLFPQFEPKIIYDIGGNIGVLAVLLANIYPNASIHTFEPAEENIGLLRRNCLPYPNIETHFFGLGDKNCEKTIYRSDDDTNLGGFSTHIQSDKGGHWCKISAVDEVMGMTGIPDLIKIDCEGAEFDILSTIGNKLSNVKWITGELHGVDEYALLALLNQYFKLSFARNFDDKVWHFHAVNKDWKVPGLST